MANEFKIKKGLIVTGASGGTVVDIQGSQGQLFSVTDDLSGSIFAVSDISGVPIFDVNSSGTVTIDGLLTGDDATFSKRLTLNSPDYAQHLTMRRGIYGYDTIITGTRVDFSPTADTLSFKFLANLQTTGDVSVSGGDLNVGSSTTVNSVINMLGTNDSFIEKDTGNHLYFANNVGDKDIKFRIKDDTTNVIALTIDGSEGGDATFTAQAFSAATSSGDASSTLTTKGYVDSLITGATIYRGTWQAGISATSTGTTSSSTTLTVSAAILDAAGNTPVLVGAVVTGAGITGTVKVSSVTSSTVYVLDTAIDATATAYIFSPIYGAPDLSGVTQTSGYYYICSEAGSATPNGAGTEPNTWGVGDWVIWNDDVGASGEWQKVDNSSVLSGVGTGQTVALWEGANSVTDSETLGNAPITVSGSNSTFAGNVTVGALTSGQTAQLVVNQEGGVSPVAKFLSRTNKAIVQISDNDTTGYVSSENGYFSLGSAAGVNAANINIATANSNVGIGVTATSDGDLTLNAPKLHVKGTNTSGAYNLVARFQGGNDADNTGAAILINHSNDRGLLIEAGRKDGDREVAYFNVISSGATVTPMLTMGKFGSAYNVGIGTTSPGSKLTVNGSFSADTGSFSNELTLSSNLRLQNNITILNKAQSAYISFATRNTTGSEVVMDLTNVGSINGGAAGPYLPLSAGSGFPLTGPLYITSDGGAANGAEIYLKHANNNTTDTIGTLFFGNNADATLSSIVVETNGANNTSNLKLNTSNAGTMSTALTLQGDNDAIFTGNVGIGTTGPNSPLDIRRTSDGIALELISTVGDADEFVDLKMISGNTTAGTLGTILRHKRDGTGGGDFSILTNPTLTGTPTEKLIVKSNGNVGIGTSTPLAKLDIQGTQGQLFSVTDNLSGSIFAVADISGVPIFDVNSSGVSYFDGDVGIGTTGPSAKLHISTGATYEVGSLSGSILIEPTGVAFDGYGAGIVLGAGRGGRASGGAAIASVLDSASDPDRSGLSFFYHNATFGDPRTEGMRLAADGNVGIGTTSPGSKLEINENSTGTVYSKVFNQNAGVSATARMAVVAQSAQLDIIATSAGYTGVSGWADSGVISTDSGASGGLILNAQTGGLKLQTALSTKMVVLASGNVGIGTTNPTQKLHLDGNNYNTATRTTFLIRDVGNNYNQGDNAIDIVMRSRYWSGDQNTSQNSKIRHLKDNSNGSTGTQLRFGTTTRGAGDSSDKMTILASGNVGIGTTSPITKLNVAGNIAVTATKAYRMYNAANNGWGEMSFIEADNRIQFNRGIQNSGVDWRLSENSASSYVCALQGNFGIGTTGPDSRLTVSSGTTNAVANFKSTDAAAYIAIADNSSTNALVNQIGVTGNDMWFATDDVERMRIDSSGNVGIGASTTSPSHTLEVRDGTISGEIAKFSAIGATVVIESSTAGNAKLFLKPNTTGSKRAEFRVTDANDYGFLWTADTSTNGTAYMELEASSTGGGDLTVKGDVIAYGSPSDKKYKENIKPIESALDKAMKLQGVTFDWKDNDSILDIKEDIGFIAQDVQEVLPELVRENKKGNLSLRYQGITPILLEAIKELKAEIEELKKQIK